MATANGAQDEDGVEKLASQHKMKLRPPTCDGDYATFEEWKYTFKAYIGVQDVLCPPFLDRAERAPTQLTADILRRAAATLEQAEGWIQQDNDLKYVLIITTQSAAATFCRQRQQELGREVYRQLHNRFSTPVGTRSIGYLTRLLTPTLDTNNFEESFCNWESELQKYEHDSNAALPDEVKVSSSSDE